MLKEIIDNYREGVRALELEISWWESNPYRTGIDINDVLKDNGLDNYEPGIISNTLIRLIHPIKMRKLHRFNYEGDF